MPLNNRRILASFVKGFFLPAIFAFLLSCEQDEIKPYENATFTDSVDIASLNDPEYALTIIRYNYEYITFHWGMFWGFANVLGGEYEDNQMELTPFQYFSHDKDMLLISSLWENCYYAINVANLFLSEIASSSDPALTHYKGQAYFYRALSYYTLLTYFGKYYPDKDMDAPGVPIISKGETSETHRASVAEVYNQIIRDLDTAAVSLPGPGPSVESASRYSALALEAKTYMWFGQYDVAAVLLEQIINSGYFHLTDRIRDNFDGEHEFNTESVFEFPYYWDGSVWMSSSDDNIPAQAYTWLLQYRKYTVTDQTTDVLGEDPRSKETYYALGDTMIDWEGMPVINNTGLSYARKYAHVIRQGSSSGYNYGNNLVFIRLADLFLLYSEAQIKKGNLELALSYINQVKARAGAEIIPGGSLTAEGLMEILRTERFLELCGEGSYWFDLIRWDLAEQKLAERGFIKGKNEALPIPGDIVDNNPGIVQNSQY